MPLQICLCALPAFVIDLIKDLIKKMGVKTRLITTAVSAYLSVYFLNILITKIQTPCIDWVFSIGVIIFTAIAIIGLAKTYNILDGFNGLTNIVAIINLLAIGYVAFKINDSVLASI